MWGRKVSIMFFTLTNRKLLGLKRASVWAGLHTSLRYWQWSFFCRQYFANVTAPFLLINNHRDDRASPMWFLTVARMGPVWKQRRLAVPNFPTPAEHGAAVYRAGCPPSLPGGPSAAEQLIKRLIISLSESDSWTEPLPMNDRGHAPLAAAKSGRTSTAPPAPPHHANLAAGRKSPTASTAIAFWSSSYTAADFTSCARVRVQRRCLQQTDCRVPNNIREFFFHKMQHSHQIITQELLHQEWIFNKSIHFYLYEGHIKTIKFFLPHFCKLFKWELCFSHFRFKFIIQI